MSTYLRPLKNLELMEIFKSLDKENKGKLNISDLSYIFTKLLGTEYSNDDLNFALKYLVHMGNNSDNGLDDNQNNLDNLELDFATFVDSVNNTLKTKPLESLLKGTFESISKDNQYVTVDDLLEFASKSGVKMTEDSRLRLQSRMPDGKADYKEFVKCVAET